MAAPDLNVPTLTTAQLATIRTHVDAIKAVLTPGFINLSPEDRQQYGSIAEQNKLFVNKVKDYNDNQPELSTPKVDWAEFGVRYVTRGNYKKVTDMIAELVELCDDPRTLIDYTLDVMARQDYRYAKFNAEDDGGNTGGYEAKYNDLKQFFTHDSAIPGTPTP